LVLNGQLTLGQLVAAELIVTLIVASVAKFGKHFESFYDLAAGISKLGELVDMPLEPVVGEHPSALEGPARAALQEVRCEVEGRVVFDGLSLEIAPGSCMAITGGAGSGKSIVLDLLFGLRRPQSGQVRIDGQDLRLAALPALRDHVVLLRDPALIDGTVEENMRLGAPLMTREQMLSALEIVGLRRRCEGMEGGLGAMLSATGSPLSSGQVVRLMLARAIAQQPRLLLIDGLLDQLSDEERTAVLGALFEGQARWTMVIISQSQEILRRCERVVRFKDGALVEVKR
jgi:putative ABC transport system ATP-binding protein